MPSAIDKAFGPYASALMLRAKRAELLATNLANADTPNYKARDMDFHAALTAALGQQAGGTQLAATASGHQAADPGSSDPNRLYRVPFEPSLDGNTVDVNQEKAQFSENALQYQASFTFLDGAIKGLLLAIKGD